MKFCSECGAKLAVEAPKFCGECGHKLETSVTAASPASAPAISESSDEEGSLRVLGGDLLGGVNQVSASEADEAKHSTDPSRLEELASSTDKRVRMAVARNSSTPVEVLTRLAGDPENLVREAVAGNPSASTEARDIAEAIAARFSEASTTSSVEVLTVLAGDSNGDVRRRALLNPACPNDVREASGLVFLFAIGAGFDFRDGSEIFPLSEHEIACDLVAVERFPTEVDDDLAAYEILKSILGRPDYDNSDDGFQDRSMVIVSAGRGAPDWWNNWSVINWPEIKGSNTRIEDALNRKASELFIKAMGEPGDDDDENVEGWAITVAFSGRESSQQAWAQILADVKSAHVHSSEQLQGLAGRWLTQTNGDERPELVLKFIEGALARNPASPPEVLRQMATADDAGLRWLVTRNPGANDEVKALAALSLSGDERFEQRVPDSDLRISPAAFSLGVRARVWPVDECPFIDELPYDSRTSTNWGADDAAIELFDGSGWDGVVYSFTSEFVDPDEDDD